MSILKVKDENGNLFNIPAIKGDKGEDGLSPTIGVSKSGKETTLTITDKNGTKTVIINDGLDGQDGVDGSDASVVVDEVLDDTSTNAIQNKVVKAKLDEIWDKIDNESLVNTIEFLDGLQECCIANSPTSGAITFGTWGDDRFDVIPTGAKIKKIEIKFTEIADSDYEGYSDWVDITKTHMIDGVHNIVAMGEVYEDRFYSGFTKTFAMVHPVIYGMQSFLFDAINSYCPGDVRISYYQESGDDING